MVRHFLKQIVDLEIDDFVTIWFSLTYCFDCLSRFPMPYFILQPYCKLLDFVTIWSQSHNQIRRVIINFSLLRIISGRGRVLPRHIPARPRHGELHGAKPLPRPPPQQLQLRGAQVPEGGRNKANIENYVYVNHRVLRAAFG